MLKLFLFLLFVHGINARLLITDGEIENLESHILGSIKKLLESASLRNGTEQFNNGTEQFNNGTEQFNINVTTTLDGKSNTSSEYIINNDSGLNNNAIDESHNNNSNTSHYHENSSFPTAINYTGIYPNGTPYSNNTNDVTYALTNNIQNATVAIESKPVQYVVGRKSHLEGSSKASKSGGKQNLVDLKSNVEIETSKQTSIEVEQQEVLHIENESEQLPKITIVDTFVYGGDNILKNERTIRHQDKMKPKKLESDKDLNMLGNLIEESEIDEQISSASTSTDGLSNVDSYSGLSKMSKNQRAAGVKQKGRKKLAKTKSKPKQNLQEVIDIIRTYFPAVYQSLNKDYIIEKEPNVSHANPDEVDSLEYVQQNIYHVINREGKKENVKVVLNKFYL